MSYRRIPVRTKRFAILATAAAVALAPAAASAEVYFSTPNTISGDTDASTAGALDYGYDWSNVSETLNNGVTFTGTSSTTTVGANLSLTGLGTDSTTAFGSATGSPWSTLSSSYQGTLTGGVYGAAGTSGSVTLESLTVGHQYQAEIWVNDDRSGSTAARSETLISTGGNSQSLTFNSSGAAGGVGQFALGYFTAGSATQLLTIASTGSSNVPQLNALQLRDVTNIGYWNGIASGTWDTNTTANFCTNLYSSPLTTGTLSAVSATVPNVYFGDSYYNNGTTTAVTQNNITVAAGGVSAGNVYFLNNSVAYTVNSADTVGITGAASVTLKGTGTVILTGVNTYSGVTDIQNGTLVLGNAAGSIAASSAVALGSADLNTSGILQLGDAANPINQTIASLSTLGTGTANAVVGGNSAISTLTINNPSADTFSGILGGSGNGNRLAIVKMGAGALDLTGTNTYTGGTTISAGTLEAKTTGALPGYSTPNSISVGAGATLAVNAGGTGEWTSANLDTLRSSVTFNSGSFLAIDTTDASAAFAYASNISGGMGLVKLGANTLDLTGTNAYTGGTTVSAGTLEAKTPGALPGYNAAGVVMVNGGATLAVNAGGAGEWTAAAIDTLRSDGVFSSGTALGIDTTDAASSFTYASNISGNLGLTKLGTNTLILTGANTFTGTTMASAGTLQLGDGVTTNLSVAGNIVDNATVTFNNPGNQTYGGTLSGTGTLNKSGAGTLTLAGSLTLTGTVNVNAGTLVLPSAVTLSAGPKLVIANGVTVQSPGTLTTNASSAAQATVVSGAGTLNLTSLTSSATNPDINFDANDAANSGTNFGSTLSANLNLGSSQRYIWGRTNHNAVGKYGTSADCVFTGSISGTGGLTFMAQATYTSSPTMEVPFYLDDSNTFTGPVQIQRGSVYLGNANALAQGNALSFAPVSGNNARLFLYGNNASVSDLSSSGLGTSAIANSPGNAIAAATLTVTQNNSATYAGTINQTVAEYNSGTGTVGALSVVKQGAATLTLTGSNTYTGSTTINNGTLLIADGTTQSTSGVTVNGGTFGVTSTGNTATLSNNLTFNGGTQGLSFVLTGAPTASIPPLTVGGTVTNNGSVQVNLSTTTPESLPLPGTEYILAQSANALAGTGTYTLGTMFGSNPRFTATLDTTSNPNDIQLNVTASDYLKWTAAAGSGSGAWDTSTAGNFTLANAGTTTTFQTNDVVLFGNDPGSTGTFTVTVGSGGVQPSAIEINSSANYTFTGSGPISGAATLIKNGTGTLTLNNANTFTGGTQLNAGVISINNGSALGTGPLTVNLTAGASFLTVANTAAVTLPNNIVLPAPTAAATYALVKSSGGTALTLNGNISGGGANTIFELNAGTSGDNTTTCVLSGNNTFQAEVNLNRGGIVVNSATALGNPANLIYLDGNNNTSLGDLRFQVPVTLPNPIQFAVSCAVNTNANSITFTGPISGSATFTKLGTGTLTLLNGASAFSGTTAINAGSMLVSNISGSATGTGKVTVATAASLGGAGFIGLGTGTNSVSIAANATLAPGIPAATGNTLTVTGGAGVALVSGSVLSVKTAASGTNDTLAVTGTGNLAIAGSTLSLTSTGTGAFTIATVAGGALTGQFGSVLLGGVNEGTNPVITGPGNDQLCTYPDVSVLYNETNASSEAIQVTIANYPATVPEPGALGLLAIGSCGLLCRRRRRAGRR